MNLQGIKCIIFDLGAVIIDIDVPKTFEAIAQRINSSASEIPARAEVTYKVPSEPNAQLDG